jgi:hypothetical protein
MGEAGMELERTYIYDNHWHRRPNETERQFRDRATSETPRKEYQAAPQFGSVTNTRASN